MRTVGDQSTIGTDHEATPIALVPLVQGHGRKFSLFGNFIGYFTVLNQGGET